MVSRKLTCPFAYSLGVSNYNEYHDIFPIYQYPKIFLVYEYPKIFLVYEYHEILRCPFAYSLGVSYGVATISRLLKMIGLFCKRAL